MAQKWRKRLIVAGLFLGSCSLLIPLSVAGWGIEGQNVGLGAASAAATTQAARPLELALTEIATIARQDMVERLRVSGELQLAHRVVLRAKDNGRRSEEHTSELQSLMRISYAVFCLTKKQKITVSTHD